VFWRVPCSRRPPGAAVARGNDRCERREFARWDAQRQGPRPVGLPPLRTGNTNGSEGTKFWLAVLTELSYRGVRICIVVCDGLKGRRTRSARRVACRRADLHAAPDPQRVSLRVPLPTPGPLRCKTAAIAEFLANCHNPVRQLKGAA